MNKLKAICIHVPLVFIGIGLSILAIPLAIIVSIVGLIARRKLNAEFNTYLKELEGRNFFCYNNRQNSYAYITKEIIPNLPDGVEPLFLNGKQIECKDLNPKFMSKAFNDFKNYRNFPHMMKIRNGRVYDESLNHELYLSLNQNQDQSQIFDKMKVFLSE